MMKKILSQSKSITPIDNWININKVLKLYKITTMGLLLTTILLTSLIFNLINEDPTVVLINKEDKNFYGGRKRKIKLEEKDLKTFIEDYVHARYSWENINPSILVRNLSPISTNGFLKKLRAELKKEKEGSFKQTITNLEIVLTEKESFAKFDKIFKINNIPLIVPTEISLKVIQGERSKWNPMGLYVDGIVEHNGR